MVDTPLLQQMQVGAQRLAYESHGPLGAPVVVLVHGLGQQLTAWPDALVAALLRAGYRVVRFDNRDIGKSARCSGTPAMAWLYLRARLGLRSKAPYLLDDMAQDTASLIEQLGAGPVHLVGASMGGMIAQIVAARYPAALRSLVSIMSSSGAPGLPGARPDVLKLILNPPRHPTPAQELDYGVRNWELIASPAHPTPQAVWRERVRRDLARNAPAAGGVERQFAAILASGSRVPLLRLIDAPTLVLHGEQDPLVPIAAGRSTARHIRGARFVGVAGMGHDMPEALLPMLAELLLRHFRSVDAAPPSIRRGAAAVHTAQTGANA